MTLHRLRAARGAETTTDVEVRAGGLASYPSGWGLMDPAAIPPPGMFQTQRAGVPVTPHTSLQVDAVFTAMRIITNAMIKLGNARSYKTELSPDNIPYRVWQEEQPAILFDTFGPGMFQYDGIRRTVMSMGLFGEAFWHVLTRDKLQYAETLEVLHPAFMKIEILPNGLPIYEYGTGVHKTVLPREDVVHIPNLALPGAARGLSGIEYGGVAFALALAALEYGERWFSQGASPSYILTTPNKLGPAEIDRIAEKFLIDHAGLQNAHLPLVLDSDMKAQKIQSSPDEAQFLQTLEYARSAIASWFGVPDFLLRNALQRNAPDPPGTVQERTMIFIQYTLSGYLVPIEAAFSSLIEGDLNAAFDTSRFDEPDAKSLAAEVTAYRQSQVASINDIRARKLGWAPLDDPRADDAMAPLASNTSPEQTEHGDHDATHGPESDPAPEPDDQLAAQVAGLETRLRDEILRRELWESSDGHRRELMGVVQSLERRDVAREEEVRGIHVAIRSANARQLDQFLQLVKDHGERDHKLLEGLETLSKAILDRPNEIHVDAPEIHAPITVEAAPTPNVTVEAPPSPPAPDVRVDVQPPDVKVDVAAPEVTVQAPELRIKPPDVFVDVKPPEVKVDAPTVNVQPPDVKVDIASPEIKVEPYLEVPVPTRGGKSKTRIVRDPRTGMITGVEKDEG